MWCCVFVSCIFLSSFRSCFPSASFDVFADHREVSALAIRSLLLLSLSLLMFACCFIARSFVVASLFCCWQCVFVLVFALDGCIVWFTIFACGSSFMLLGHRAVVFSCSVFVL